MPETTLDRITDQAKALAEQRARLHTLVTAMQQGIEALHASNLPAIREAINSATAAWTGLESMVRENPQLFIKPRKVKAHGITFGLEKGKGVMTIANPDKTCALIRKHLPEQADVLIATTEAPAKEALAQLSAEQLKKLGVVITDTGDRVVIRASDTDTDKLVKALIRSAVDETEETA